MYSEFKIPDVRGDHPDKDVLNNIHIIKNEISLHDKNLHNFSSVPVYRTVREFKLQEFLLIFGLGKTDVFKLTQTFHSSRLPSLVVLHCSGNALHNDTLPQIVSDKIYMCQHYFLERVAKQHDIRLQTELLQILLDTLCVENPYEN